MSSLQQTGHKPLSELRLSQFTDIYAALGGDDLTQWSLEDLDAILKCNF